MSNIDLGLKPYFSINLILSSIAQLQLFKEIATEADSTLRDLQESLHSQETKLTVYAQQQRDVSISNSAWILFRFSLFPTFIFNLKGGNLKSDIMSRLIAEQSNQQGQFPKLQRTSSRL